MLKIKNIIVSIIILVFLFFLINTTILIINCKKYNYNISQHIKTLFFREPYSISLNLERQNAGIVTGEEYNKKGIVLFGCGFAYGLDLNDNQKFNAKLAPILKRPVYNYAIPGSYIQNAIIMLQSGIIDNILKNCDYAVYMISELHSDAYRLETYPGPYIDEGFLININTYPVFKLSKDNILQDPKLKKNILNDSFISRLLDKFYILNLKKEEDKFENTNTYLHLLKLQEELKKKNPDIKMIVFFYFSSEEDFGQYADLLKEHGIQIFSATDSTKENIQEIPKYIQSQVNFHPTEDAWNLLAPIFAKEMKLQ